MTEPIGLSGRESMHYGLELAQRGYVVLCPDYPSLGEHTYDFAANPEFASGRRARGLQAPRG